MRAKFAADPEYCTYCLVVVAWLAYMGLLFVAWIPGGLGVYAYLLFLDSLGFPYQSLLCVSPPKQYVRRLRSLKGHVCACGCNNKMFRTC